MASAYGDLEALNLRLMASLEDTTVQIRLLHGKLAEDQAAAADAERTIRADAAAELAMLRAAHEAGVARAVAESGAQLELMVAQLEASRYQVDEVEARAAACQSGLMGQLHELRESLEAREAEAEVLMLQVSELAGLAARDTEDVATVRRRHMEEHVGEEERLAGECRPEDAFHITCYFLYLRIFQTLASLVFNRYLASPIPLLLLFQACPQACHFLRWPLQPCNLVFLSVPCRPAAASCRSGAAAGLLQGACHGASCSAAPWPHVRA